MVQQHEAHHTNSHFNCLHISNDILKFIQNNIHMFSCKAYLYTILGTKLSLQLCIPKSYFLIIRRTITWTQGADWAQNIAVVFFCWHREWSKGDWTMLILGRWLCSPCHSDCNTWPHTQTLQSDSVPSGTEMLKLI